MGAMRSITIFPDQARPVVVLDWKLCRVSLQPRIEQSRAGHDGCHYPDVNENNYLVEKSMRNACELVGLYW